MISFASPELLWLLALLPLWLFLRGRRGGAPAVRYSNAQLAARAARDTRSRALGLLPLLRIPAVALLIVALARPQLGRAETRVHASGIDILLAVDVSSSMEAPDMDRGGATQTRLAAVKDVVARFIDARPNDRIGLVAFAGAPYLVSPLTLDHEWLRENLGRLETGLVEDGTAIGSALAASVDRLQAQEARSRVVVLLTDGVNNSGTIQPSLAAETARSLGVKVYTVGVGVAGEAVIPIRERDGRVRRVRADVEVDEDTLRRIADATGGRFFRARDTESLAAVYGEIDRMERTERSIDRFHSYDERYALFLLPGLGLFGLELLLGFGLRRRVP